MPRENYRFTTLFLHVQSRIGTQAAVKLQNVIQQSLVLLFIENISKLYIFSIREAFLEYKFLKVEILVFVIPSVLIRVYCHIFPTIHQGKMMPRCVYIYLTRWR